MLYIGLIECDEVLDKVKELEEHRVIHLKDNDNGKIVLFKTDNQDAKDNLNRQLKTFCNSDNNYFCGFEIMDIYILNTFDQCRLKLKYNTYQDISMCVQYLNTWNNFKLTDVEIDKIIKSNDLEECIIKDILEPRLKKEFRKFLVEKINQIDDLVLE